MSTPLAAGRTADVFAGGPGRIRRVYRDGRDATTEATLMRHLASHGYPVPEVFDARARRSSWRRSRARPSPTSP